MVSATSKITSPEGERNKSGDAAVRDNDGAGADSFEYLKQLRSESDQPSGPPLKYDDLSIHSLNVPGKTVLSFLR